MSTRRGFLIGAGATLAAPSILHASTDAARVFRVLRDGDDIGVHTISVSRSNGEVQVAIDIELKVKFLGVTAYRENGTDGAAVISGTGSGTDTMVNSIVDNLAGQWLYIRAVDEAMPDYQTFPDFDEDLRASMKEEMHRMVSDILLGDHMAFDRQIALQPV